MEIGSEAADPPPPPPPLLADHDRLKGIRNLWELPYLNQFLVLHREKFNFPRLTIQELEECLLENNNLVIVDIITRLLRYLTGKTVKTNDYEDCLQELLTAKKSDSHPLKNNKFAHLTAEEKVQILKWLVDHTCEEKDDDLSEFLNDSFQSDDLRAISVGQDAFNNTYWYFDDLRLYREGLNKKAAGKKDWECVCITLNDWNALLKKFRKSLNPQEKELYEYLNKEIFPIIEVQLQSQETQEHKDLSPLENLDLSTENLLKREEEDIAKMLKEQDSATPKSGDVQIKTENNGITDEKDLEKTNQPTMDTSKIKTENGGDSQPANNTPTSTQKITASSEPVLSSVKTEPQQQSMGGTKASSGGKAGALHKPLQQLKPQVSMDSTHFMQQQSQIFVFSTELANKAAESVLSGQYKSIISFHCDQPGTKQMLQKHPLKSSQFNRQQLGGMQVRPPNSGMVDNQGMMGGEGNPNYTAQWVQQQNANLQNYQNFNEMNAADFQPPQNNMNLGPPGGPPGNQPGGNGNNGPWPPSQQQPQQQGNPNMGMQPPPGMQNSPGNNFNPMMQSGGGGGPVFPPGMNMPMDIPTSMIGSFMSNPANSNLMQSKVPDENLTPEQRQKREESLANLRKIQQLLFPDQGGEGGPHPPNPRMGMPGPGGMNPAAMGPNMNNMNPNMMQNMNPNMFGPNRQGMMPGQQNMMMPGQQNMMMSGQQNMMMSHPFGGPNPPNMENLSPAQREWFRLQQEFYHDKHARHPHPGKFPPGHMPNAGGGQGPPPSYFTSVAQRRAAPGSIGPSEPTSPNPNNGPMPSPHFSSGHPSPAPPADMQGQFMFPGQRRPSFGSPNQLSPGFNPQGPGPGPVPGPGPGPGPGGPPGNFEMMPGSPAGFYKETMMRGGPPGGGKIPEAMLQRAGNPEHYQPVPSPSTPSSTAAGSLNKPPPSYAQSQSQKRKRGASEDIDDLYKKLQPAPSPQQINYLNQFEGQELTITKQLNNAYKEPMNQSPMVANQDGGGFPGNHPTRSPLPPTSSAPGPLDSISNMAAMTSVASQGQQNSRPPVTAPGSVSGPPSVGQMSVASPMSQSGNIMSPRNNSVPVTSPLSNNPGVVTTAGQTPRSSTGSFMSGAGQRLSHYEPPPPNSALTTSTAPNGSKQHKNSTMDNITSASLANLAKGVENLSNQMQQSMMQGGPFHNIQIQGQMTEISENGQPQSTMSSMVNPNMSQNMGMPSNANMPSNPGMPPNQGMPQNAGMPPGMPHGSGMPPGAGMPQGPPGMHPNPNFPQNPGMAPNSGMQSNPGMMPPNSDMSGNPGMPHNPGGQPHPGMPPNPGMPQNSGMPPQQQRSMGGMPHGGQPPNVNNTYVNATMTIQQMNIQGVNPGFEGNPSMQIQQMNSSGGMPPSSAPPGGAPSAMSMAQSQNMMSSMGAAAANAANAHMDPMAAAQMGQKFPPGPSPSGQFPAQGPPPGSPMMPGPLSGGGPGGGVGPGGGPMPATTGPTPTSTASGMMPSPSSNYQPPNSSSVGNANVQIQAKAPNTIQYLPANPPSSQPSQPIQMPNIPGVSSMGVSGKQQAEMEMMRRFSSPMSGMDPKMNNAKHFFPETSQSQNMPPHLSRMGLSMGGPTPPMGAQMQMAGGPMSGAAQAQSMMVGSPPGHMGPGSPFGNQIPGPNPGQSQSMMIGNPMMQGSQQMQMQQMNMQKSMMNVGGPRGPSPGMPGMGGPGGPSLAPVRSPDFIMGQQQGSYGPGFQQFQQQLYATRGPRGAGPGGMMGGMADRMGPGGGPGMPGQRGGPGMRPGPTMSPNMAAGMGPGMPPHGMGPQMGMMSDGGPMGRSMGMPMGSMGPGMGSQSMHPGMGPGGPGPGQAAGMGPGPGMGQGGPMGPGQGMMAGMGPGGPGGMPSNMQFI